MAQPMDSGLNVVFEDPGLVVVDKPPGLPTAPLGPDDTKPTLCARVFEVFPEVSRVWGWRPFEGGLLFRLDNATSGLVAFARSDDAFKRFIALQNKGRVVKVYAAVVKHGPEEPEGAILFPVAHLKKPRRKMIAQSPTLPRRAIRGRWQAARTDFRLVWRAKGLAGVEFTITRAKRHQIRVHAAASGFPIVGDELYRGPPGERLMLHASRLVVPGMSLEVSSDPGDDFGPPRVQ